MTHRVVVLAFLCAWPSTAYVRYRTKAGVPMFRPDAAAIQFLVHTSIQAGAANAQGEVMITPDSDPASALTAATLTWNVVATSTARFVPLHMTSLGNDPSDGKHVMTIEDTPENRQRDRLSSRRHPSGVQRKRRNDRHRHYHQPQRVARLDWQQSQRQSAGRSARADP